MGAVWRAYDRRLRRDVAVKLLHAWIAEDAELRRRFAREARVLAPLEHEHIVRLYDYGEDGETPFLVMELVDGASLAEVARGRVLRLGTGGRDRRPDRDRARLRPRPGDRPPRPHARQRPDRERDRAGRRLGLRARAARPLVDERHDPGDAARDAGVLVARAGARTRQRARRPTCTRSAACSSGCSRAGHRSKATTGWPSGSAAPTRPRLALASCAPTLPREAVALVDALLAADPAQRPTASEVLASARGRAVGDRRRPRRRGRGRGAHRRRSSPTRSPTAVARASDATCRPQAPPRPADGRASRSGSSPPRRSPSSARRSRTPTASSRFRG